MQTWPARLILSAVCLALGVLLVSQFRGAPIDRALLSQSATDQATYLSQLYSNNESQRASLEQIQAEIAKYDPSRNGGSSNLVSLIHELQQLRMVNGAVDLTGPGVQVRISGARNTVQVLQDLVNELRNAGAEAVAVNGVRLITRSVIAEDAQAHVLVDGQPISSPYLLEAIGDPATLDTALQRKGGLIAVLQQAQGTNLQIKVSRRVDRPDWLRLPKTALAPTWHYAHPAGN